MAKDDLIKDAEANEAEVEHHNPKTTIGIEQSAGVVAYQDAPEGFALDRSLNLGGSNHEHVHTDADGVWIYRRM